MDDDVVSKFREFVASGRAEKIKEDRAAVVRKRRADFFHRLRLDRALEHPAGFRLARFLAAKISQPRTTSPIDGRGADFENRTFSVMAGGDFALIKSVEGFEDFTAFGQKQIADLACRRTTWSLPSPKAARPRSSSARRGQGVEAGAKVYFVYNNPDDILCEHVQRSREVIQDARIEKINLTTGPMGITGSTRMQATSIQLCVMLTVLEMVARELAGQERRCGSCRQQFLAQAGRTAHASLKSPELLASLAKLVALEESVYRGGHKNNYFADRLGD